MNFEDFVKNLSGIKLTDTQKKVFEMIKQGKKPMILNDYHYRKSRFYQMWMGYNHIFKRSNFEPPEKGD